MTERHTRLLENEDGGTVFVEHLILVAVVGIVVATAIYQLGMPLLRFFRFTQFVLLSPVG